VQKTNDKHNRLFRVRTQKVTSTIAEKEEKQQRISKKKIRPAGIAAEKEGKKKQNNAQGVDCGPRKRGLGQKERAERRDQKLPDQVKKQPERPRAEGLEIGAFWTESRKVGQRKR